jgi:hypothetical protein
LCEKSGLVKLGHVAIDGTKIKANASKHKAMSYDRRGETEQRLKTEIDALLKQAADIDDAEDAQYGKGRRSDELPEELARRETRLAKLQKAKAELSKRRGRRRKRNAPRTKPNNRAAASYPIKMRNRRSPSPNRLFPLPRHSVTSPIQRAGSCQTAPTRQLCSGVQRADRSGRPNARRSDLAGQR